MSVNEKEPDLELFHNLAELMHFVENLTKNRGT